MSSKKEAKQSGGIERRRTRRRPIISTFSLFVVIPRKGPHRLPIHDLSDAGIGFDLDTEGEESGDFNVKEGESLDIHLYLNQSLYLPLSVRIMRLEERNQVRRIGAEFSEEDAGFKAFQAFLQMLDSIVDVVKIEA
jgi:hypothetical protein